MLVNYQLNGSGPFVLLFNEALGDANETFTPSFRDALQNMAGYGAASTSKIPQANTQGQVTFRWSSNYASADAGLTAIANLRATFKGQILVLQVIVGATTVYFRNAVLSSSSHNVKGREVMHQLTFETDDVTLT